MKKVFSSIGNYVKNTDKLLILYCMCASGFSVLLITSICMNFMNSYRIAYVQAGASLLGLGASVVISLMDYRMLAKLWKFHVPVAVLLVAATFVFGIEVEGADEKAWLPLFGGMTFQPSELLKISFILTFALHLQHVGEEINKPSNVLLLCLHGLYPVLLIHLQGDDGTAVIFFIIFLFMFFAAGLSWKYIVPAIGSAVILAPVMWFFILSDFQKNRILTVFNPELDPMGIGYQQLRGITAIGSGQVWGRGLFSTDLQRVPKMQNDFIFSYVGEALGFMGALLVLLVLALICIKVLLVARHSQDMMGKMICTGVFAMFAAQAIVNVGMCVNVLPVIGITLPFFSAGGTSVTMLYLGIGLVLSVYMHNKTTIFDK